MIGNTKRRGLTLPEVLVTLAIVAIIAAVLVPALASQIAKGDAGRVSEDLKAVQSGVNAFAADVRRYPRSINQLANVINTTTDLDLVVGTSYTLDHVSAWRGPYFVRDVQSATASIRTGFRGNIRTALLNRTLNSVPHVAVELQGLSTSEIDGIDRLLDDGVSTTGLLVVSGTSAIYFAAVVQ